MRNFEKGKTYKLRDDIFPDSEYDRVITLFGKGQRKCLNGHENVATFEGLDAQHWFIYDFEEVQDTEFKINDYVQTPEGKGYITSICGNNYYDVHIKLEGNGGRWIDTFKSTNLIKLKSPLDQQQFKVGDIVSLNGKEYTIKEIKGKELWFTDDTWLYDENVTLLTKTTPSKVLDWKTNKPIKVSDNQTNEVFKMENLNKPTTQLEKKACERAVNESTERAIKSKQETYNEAMSEYILVETEIISMKKLLKTMEKDNKELEEKLEITAAQKKDLF